MQLDFGKGTDFAPLAARMRPTTIDQYVGQQHLVGEGKPLRKALENGQAHSMILWGPPGTGKTTLAELVANHCDAHIERISAVTSGVKEIRASIEIAKQQAAMKSKRTILFVDEVHRFNKSQQDAFLPFIEDGTVVFIGATTENPSFELNSALLSRARVYVLQALKEQDLIQVIEQALSDQNNGLGSQEIVLEGDAQKRLLQLAQGDARRLLNYLELCADFSADGSISLQVIADAIGDKVATYDKGGDHYYDLLSALHKSIRGSSVDGALYWYARILDGGGEATQVARRLLAIASEDIGNADPKALQICLNAWDVYHRVGAAEGERAVAQAVIYCAIAAKSNAVYLAFNQAKEDARALPDYPVPNHLRNAPTDLMKKMGHGEGYRYAHNEPNAYAAGEQYLPTEIMHKQYYQPSNRGLEKQIKAKLDYLADLDQQSSNNREK